MERMERTERMERAKGKNELVNIHIFMQAHMCTNYSVRMYISEPNIQKVRIFQYQMFSQQGHSSTNHSIGRDVAGPMVQSVGIFQYNIFSQ
jgi:hypothetical protein